MAADPRSATNAPHTPGGDVTFFTVLGPVSVTAAGQAHTLPRAQRRALLGFLLLNANRVVASETLVEALWGGVEPATSRAQIQAGISAVRAQLRALGMPEPLTSSPAGYLLRVEDDQLDLLLFERLIAEARQLAASGRPAAAAGRYRAGLALWRGPVLGGAAGAFVVSTRVRLAERRLAAVEDLIDQELLQGHHAEVVSEFAGLLDDWPLRERLRGQLMLALYRATRKAEALQLYRDHVAVLKDQHGLDPSPTLSALHVAILRTSPALDLESAAPAGGAGAGAPPPRTGPAQLPPDLADFTGRAGALRQLDDMTCGGPGQGTVTITVVAGTAGVGKTALAVRWAHRSRDRFPDGQLYVDLRGYADGLPRAPIQALAHFLCALGVRAEAIPTEMETATALFRSLLDGRRMLVVLDNAHGSEQVRPLLPGSPSCAVLVTSRDRLAGLVASHGARHLELDLLPGAEATELLARILGADRADAEPDAVAELACLCACLPLAVRVAGANLACHPEESVAGYVHRLRAGDPLASLAVDDDPERAVHAAFDLSYRRLGPDARRLFHLLGLVPGPDLTAEAAAALAGTSTQGAGRLLRRLADAHLAEPRAPGRFRMHELLRLYAAEQARRHEPKWERRAATRRLLGWYLRAADAAARLLYPQLPRLPVPPPLPGCPPAGFDTPAAALAWLDAERANLVAAVQRTAEHGHRSLAWLLADTMRGYSWQRRRPSRDQPARPTGSSKVQPANFRANSRKDFA
jgi:DNA-binding SARP family transcriptional activator